jgi:aspartyl-tRNA synthetase
MKDRTLIGNLKDHIGEYVNIAGWVNKLRDQKKMQFLSLRDHTGLVQTVNFKQGKSLDDLISSLTPDCTLFAGGNIIENPQVKLNGYEIQLDYVDVQSRPLLSLIHSTEPTSRTPI